MFLHVLVRSNFAGKGAPLQECSVAISGEMNNFRKSKKQFTNIETTYSSFQSDVENISSRFVD